ncbi:uncharacterized protein LOC118562525 isoform X1 [Fundulus heteroclitus]|uniref:uncharacterized protein LOC118562525 isoform X1 n=1 Tax=Fundulus heteroclitus TaxID=8078 RepID=UPI00165AA7CC|nr:uncharacterized protein LOC118562525 isoform X1 [Fundulus heteroclitus]
MKKEAEVLYRTCPWPDDLLQSARKSPAGMLFSIEASEGAISQLHLPHCETKEALLGNGLLSVAHITDNEGMTILEPATITDTHVLVDVPHLSLLGLMRSALQRLMKLPVNGQVLLFHKRPCTLYVLLLQDNIPLSEVSAQYEEAEHIRVSSECRLIFDQTYSLRSEPEASVDPESKPFLTGYGPNFHPTFVVTMTTTTNPDRVTLVLQDHQCSEVWKHGFHLAGPPSQNSSSGGAGPAIAIAAGEGTSSSTPGTSATQANTQPALGDEDEGTSRTTPSTLGASETQLRPGTPSRKTAFIKGGLFNILNNLKKEKFEDFKWYLKQESLDNSPPIQEAELENAERRNVVDLVVSRYGLERALEVMERVLNKMGENSLVEEIQKLRLTSN